VAARIVPAANASDGGGSVRIPASNCGLVGLKVSRGRTPSGPDAGEGWAGLANEHALTRTVRDSAAILDATHGPAPGDPYFAKAPERPFLDEVGRDPGKLRIALMTAPPDGRAVDDACVTEARKAATLCESLGHNVEEAGPVFDFEAMLRAIRVVVGGSVGFGIETRLHALDRELRQGDVENITKTWAEEGASYSARDFAEAVFALHQVARDFGAFFEDYDVLLSPTLGRVPMKLGERPMDGTDLDAYYAHQCDIIPFTTPYNAAGAPAISLPLGWSADGLPVGVQFGAAMGNEGLLLRLASQIETAAPWATRRPG
jgi:Asp-tRNA(Asn)/Glu-tRNA(Gln) amidotransferase A subunit family amidase